jgi:molecular chaperone GrpE
VTDPFAARGEEPVDQMDTSPESSTGHATGQEAHEDLAVIPGDEEVQLTLARSELAERTADLQRVQAEFLNYKRRVERDRDLIRENATYAALAPITEVLDTIDRAREHGDLDPGFQAVADQLERIVTGLGVTKFGAVGEPFDPAIHDALSHIGEDPDVQVTTCKVVAKAGYRIGDRVVRPAQVLVVDPVAAPSDSPAGFPADSPADSSAEEITEDDLRDIIEAIDEE